MVLLRLINTNKIPQRGSCVSLRRKAPLNPQSPCESQQAQWRSGSAFEPLNGSRSNFLNHGHEEAWEISPESVNAAPLHNRSSTLRCSLATGSLTPCTGKRIKSEDVGLGSTASRHCFNCVPLIRSIAVTLLEEQCSSRSTACWRRACGVAERGLTRFFRHRSNASTI
jgi:hypothetical protein